jgi:hypothetical protein
MPSTTVGTVDATETATSGSRFRLFTASSEFEAFTGLHVTIGHRVTSMVEAEGSASFAKPTLTTTTGNDAENAAAATIAESVKQFTIEGGAVVSPRRWQIRSRVHAHALGGGGYIRDVHERNTLVQEGKLFYGGGGVRILLSSRGPAASIKQIGVRADLRMVIRSGDVMLDGRSHASPDVRVSLFARF